ncbi:hypothetical protein GCM10010372_31100 [Streptomyces tauricus]|uniref:helix-turn-helix domain-containing protein n=1 Tax=Streptomyces tauricus TaxID=68274 RepID=UPI0016798F02|nr:hypothetical protein GCM10010372_31100 [Streptomyces tauricus]
MKAQGEIIRRSREESGYGLREFASHIGISASYLSRIETNQARPSPGVVKRIAVQLRSARETRAAIAEITRSEDEATDDTPGRERKLPPPERGRAGRAMEDHEDGDLRRTSPR